MSTTEHLINRRDIKILPVTPQTILTPSQIERLISDTSAAIKKGVRMEEIPIYPSNAFCAGNNINTGTLLTGEIMKIKEIEKDNKKFYYYNVAGMNPGDITVKTEWINKSCEIYITINGESEVDFEKDKISISDKIYIDTKVYEGWDFKIKNGILTVILIEKINPKPDFMCIPT